MPTPLSDTAPTRRCRLALFPAVIVGAVRIPDRSLGFAATRRDGALRQHRPAPRGDQGCGFPIFGHFEGDFRLTVFYDNEGNIVREVDTFPTVKVTVYAPSTGKSYTSASPAVVITTYTDGAAVGSTAIVSLTGLLEKVGDVDLDSGRLVFEAAVDGYDAAGVPHIHFVSEISSVGPDLDAFIGVQRCAAVR